MTKAFVIEPVYSAREIENIISSIPDVLSSLQKRVVIPEYCKKIATNADNFILKDGEFCKAFISVYANDYNAKVAYITQIFCISGERHKGYGSYLLNFVADFAAGKGMTKIKLEVAVDNINAINCYQKHAFTETSRTERSIFMEKILLKEEQNDKTIITF